MDIHEEYIFINRLKLLGSSSFVCILPTKESCREFTRVFKKSIFIQSYFTVSSGINIQSKAEASLASKKHFVNVCSVDDVLDDALSYAT